VLVNTRGAGSILQALQGQGSKNEHESLQILGMPSHGVEIIDGIPVHLKDGNMFAFQHGGSLNSDQATSIKLGTYDTATKKATWLPSDAMGQWLENFRTTITGRSRK
jgi:hypothetical protein